VKAGITLFLTKSYLVELFEVDVELTPNSISTEIFGSRFTLPANAMFMGNPTSFR
jgi:hypothetical protein